ncbi:hypothetical protein [Bergeyella sp. RCAD1439]|uniref:hypothetical protein n=1 Tax=Bergeyella anatis TaxID=3113737 RepID=UPI002E16BB8B|nr:hypothetical protein [Bergeyella sp. RCAD1439]
MIIGFLFVVYTILSLVLIKILKNRRIKNKTILFMIFTLVFLSISIILFISLWNTSSYREEALLTQEYINTHLKKIQIVNETNDSIKVIIDFEYSDKEIEKRKDVMENIADYFNKKSLVYIEPFSDMTIILPIKINEKIRFPKNFKIKLDNSNKSITYNEEIFFNNVVSKPRIESNKEKYKANEWILIINNKLDFYMKRNQSNINSK